MKISANILKSIVPALMVAGAALALQAAPALAQTATDVRCRGCVEKKDIKDNAISTSKLKNNAVKSAKIKNGAVTTPKLRGNAVTAGKTADEGGADFAGGPQDVNLDGGNPITVRSVSITAPSSGVVIVNASGFFDFNNGLDQLDTARCSITTGNNVDLNNAIVGSDNGDAVNAMPFGATRGFDVVPGSTTFNLVCDEQGAVVVFDSQMTALFVPTKY